MRSSTVLCAILSPHTDTAARTAACSRVQLAGTGRLYSHSAAYWYRPHIFPVCSMTGLMNCRAFIITATCSIHITHCSTAEHGTGLGLTLNIEKIVIFRSKSNKTTYYNNCSVPDLPLSTQQLKITKAYLQCII